MFHDWFSRFIPLASIGIIRLNVVLEQMFLFAFELVLCVIVLLQRLVMFITALYTADTQITNSRKSGALNLMIYLPDN